VTLPPVDLSEPVVASASPWAVGAMFASRLADLRASSLGVEPFGVSGREALEVRAGVALVHVRGALTRGRRYGTTAQADVLAALHGALESDASRVVLVIDGCWGGESAGLMKLTDAVREAARRRELLALVRGYAVGAGFVLASAAPRVVAEADAIVGGCGMFAVVTDSSEAYAREGIKVHVLASGPHKGMGTPGTPVTPAQIAMHQAVIDQLGRMHVDAVREGRGARLSAEGLEQILRGAHWLAPAARALGIVDALGGLDLATRGMRSAADAPASIAAPPAPVPSSAPAPVATFNPPAAPIAAPANPESSMIRYRQFYDQNGAALLAAGRARAEQAGSVTAGMEAAAAEDAARKGVDAPLSEPRDFVAVARERAKANGTSYTAEAEKLAAEEPELHAAYVDRTRELGDPFAKRLRTRR
jgi:ClpP class serine protease